MRRSGILSLCLLALAATAAGEDFPKLSPFEALRFEGGVPHVQVRGRTYVLVAIEGVPVSKVVAHARTTYRDDWEKRLSEDLVEVMAGMGTRLGDEVDLRVLDPETKKEETLGKVPNTRENRRRLRDARAAVDRVQREHATHVSEALRPLQRRFESGAPLDASKAAEDLDQLEWLLDRRFSYAKRLGVDYRAALDAIRAGLGDGITTSAFAIQVHRAIALLGDGHSGVDQVERHLPRGFLPFLVADSAEGPVAFRDDRSAFLDPKRPYLRSIDGEPLDEWVEAAGALVARGAPHHVRIGSVRGLRHLAWMRAERGRPASDTVRVEVSGPSGKDRKALELPLAARKPTYGVWPRGESRVLDGDVGYLRIESMESDPAVLDRLVASMKEMRPTRGLVIDVRGNGGGRRDALRTLFPFFADRVKGGARVANVAAYRLAPGEAPDASEDRLDDRFLWPASWSGWSLEARRAIDALAPGFRPEWALPQGEFSRWHWFVLEKGEDARTFSYEKPVVVLMDGGCFSATDIFLGALKGLARVTLVGTASGGGSGRKQSYRLAHSGLTVELSSMASFRPDGLLYDGRGVEPDVGVLPAANDHIGTTDSVLDAARSLLR